MSGRATTSPLAPNAESTVYLVLDCQSDLQTLVADLFSGRYRHPLRVVAFNPVEGSMCDVTAEIARAVRSGAAELDHEFPVEVRDFLERAGA
jgi:hypothetical protein